MCGVEDGGRVLQRAEFRRPKSSGFRFVNGAPFAARVVRKTFLEKAGAGICCPGLYGPDQRGGLLVPRTLAGARYDSGRSSLASLCRRS